MRLNWPLRTVCMMRARWLAALLIALPMASAPADEAVFTPADIIDWAPHSFTGDTDYALSPTDEGEVLVADCREGTASGLFYRESIDLTQTPVIEWRWRVLDPISAGDPETKAGDDYAARIYAVDEHAILRWRTRALNYVSTTRQPKGADWANRYASQARMIAVDNAGGQADGWQTHRRNLREDFQRFHDREVDTIEALAIMTDCDDTGETARAQYGTIRLRPE